MKEFCYVNDCTRRVQVDLDDTHDVVRAYLRECRAAASDLRAGEPGQDDHIVTLYADGVMQWENFGMVWGGEHMFGHGALFDVELIAYTNVRDRETTTEIIRTLLEALRERGRTKVQPTTAHLGEPQDQGPQNRAFEAAWRLQFGLAGEDDVALARASLADAGTVPARLRAAGWDGEGRPNHAIIGLALERALAEPRAVSEGVDFGERVDLFAAYSNPPPPRDDVLLGLEPGSVMAIGAPGGGSKTFFMLALAHDLALGGTVNAMRTTLVADRKQRVGILTAEESVTELARRVHAVGFGLNDDQRRHVAEYIDIRSVRREMPILIERDGSVNKKTFDQVARFADGKRAVGLDPLGRFCRADKNDENVMLLLVTKLEQIAQKVGCIFMLTHHVGKAAILSGNGDSALAMKGSIALIDSCRMAIMISRPPKKIAEERRLGVSRRHRIVKTDKANHLADKGEVWFRVRDDGTLEYDELQNAWQPERIVNDVVAEIGGFAEDVIPPQGRMHAIIKADGGEGRFEAKPTSARAAFFRGRK